MPQANPTQSTAESWTHAVWRVWAGAMDLGLRILPLLVLSMLALLSHWLIRNAPQADVQAAEKVASQRPDYVMHDFTTLRYDEGGQLLARLKGVQMRHLPEPDVFEVDQPRHEQWGTNGRLTRSMGRKGVSNADGSEIQLLTEVEVVRYDRITDEAPSMRITGAFLHLKAQNEQISSHLPVVIERGKDRFEGNAMHFDNLSQQLQLDGSVKSRFVPPKR